MSAFAAGGVFGAGLLLSGMTDTRKVQGFLDITGAWDPTLAFVLGGAVLPMILVWWLADARSVSLLGDKIPTPAPVRFDPGLIWGSGLFGVGWGLVGLCPGPALALISFGGIGGVVFLLAMLMGMLLSTGLRKGRFRRNKGTAMDIRALTPTYAVSPQITQDDLAAIKAAGYTTIINNRPDGEIPAALHSDAMQAAAEAMGFTFVVNPVISGAMTMDNVTTQQAAIAAADGPVFAYCASGNRCSVVWALAHAGQMSADDLVGIPARYGYQLDHLRPQIAALAAKG